MSDATNTTVTDHLPTGLALASTPTGTGWDCSGSSGSTVTCSHAALLTVGNAPAITVPVNVSPTLRGSVANTAHVASNTTDPNPNNNNGSANVNIVADADLGVVKSHTGDFIQGEQAKFDFTVTNSGPALSPSFTVTDTLNSNLTHVGVKGEATCDFSSPPTLVRTGGSLDPSGPDSTAHFTVTVAVSLTAPLGPMSNTGAVATPTGTTDLIRVIILRTIIRTLSHPKPTWRFS